MPLNSVTALVKAVRTSCRTFQLFEITKAVLEKNDRFVVVIQRKTPEGAEPGPAAADAAKPAKGAPLFLSMPDHLPFETEDAAIAHVLKNHLANFFELSEAEVEAPKGNFPIINKCGVTGELLGPPNYHRYNQIVQQHYAAKVASRMGFEAFRSRIETIRDPEVANQWLTKMKKTTRYTWKLGTPGGKAAEPAPAESVAPAVADESAADAASAAPTEPATRAA